jgi:hypothetical protein
MFLSGLKAMGEIRALFAAEVSISIFEPDASESAHCVFDAAAPQERDSLLLPRHHYSR